MSKILSVEPSNAMERLGRVVLDRLILYYRHLVGLMARQPVSTITSGSLGQALDIDPSQVRKDFAAIGLVGMARIGYDACEVCRAIRTGLGFDQAYRAVLIGVGKLGGAILTYADFERYGLQIVAAFDVDPLKVGRPVSGTLVRPLTELASFVEEHQIPLGILCLPADAAQGVADILVSAGVRALWNFTPALLSAPVGVLVREERFSAGLAEIAYHLLRPLDRRETTAIPGGTCVSSS